MVNVYHNSSNGGFKEIFDRIQKLSSQKVAVGIPASKNKRTDKNGEKTDIDNSDLAYIQTHGVRLKAAREEMQPEINQSTEYSKVLQMYIHEHGSMAYQVPPRPIIEPAIEDSKEELGELLGKAAQAAVEGNDTQKVLEDVGQFAQGEVDNWFENPKNGWPANAPSTIKQKGSDKPLIDTGELRKAITFEVRSDDDD